LDDGTATIHHTKDIIMEEIYADAAWTVTDITSRWDCTEKQAKAFLNEHDRHLRDWMVEQGWFWLEETVPFPKREGGDEESEEIGDQQDNI
jgi:hypothetical protein